MENENQIPQPPSDFPKLLEAVLKAKLEGLSAQQQQSWWDCFVECLARENGDVKECLMHCIEPCMAGPNPLCTACIIACGGIAWWKIIACAWECS